MKKNSKTATVIALTVLFVLFAGAIVAVKLIQPRIDARRLSEVREISSPVTAEELDKLEAYTGLESADFTGSTCYEDIEAWSAAHPGVEVTYTVALGGREVPNSAAELTLERGSCTASELSQSLKYLKKLRSLSLPRTELTAHELSELAALYPDVDINYTVTFAGEEYACDCTELTLHSAEGLDTLDMLPALEKLSLDPAMSVDEALRVREAMPECAIEYSFELFGQSVKTDQERLCFTSLDIGNDGLTQIERVLPLLPELSYLKLDSCGIDYALLDEFRSAHSDFKTVWRVYFGYYNCLTDIETVLATGYLPTDAGKALKYCTEVKYLDLGHNPQLEDVDFLRYMPHLKVLILADARVNTVEPLSQSAELEWLELSNCVFVKDLSPLAGCVSLKGINMSRATGIRELSPLYELKTLERLYLGKMNLSTAERNGISEALPDCWISFECRSKNGVSSNYGVGWRLEEDGSYAEWYAFIREVFRYDEHYWTHDEGWE